MAQRKIPVDPSAAREAAKAAAAEKAKRNPGALSEAEALLLPGKTLLDLGNLGHLRHLGIGLPVKRAAVPKATANRSARPTLTDGQVAKMSGENLGKAVAAGRVDGIGARRKRRH